MILILGTPGAGKTTQTRLLAEYLDCPWFSMGELIRQEVTGKDRQEMLAGKIIDDGVTMDIVDKILAKIDTANKECLFEGSPRGVNQARWWIDQEKAGRFKIKGVIHLMADLKVAENRLVKRGRLDDHSDNVIDERFHEYQKSITPTLAYLKEKNVPTRDIDANGTIEAVAANIHKALGV